MTAQTIKEAEDYVKRSLLEQERLGYSSSVGRDVYDSAVRDVARAVQQLRRASRTPVSRAA